MQFHEIAVKARLKLPKSRLNLDKCSAKFGCQLLRPLLQSSHSLDTVLIVHIYCPQSVCAFGQPQSSTQIQTLHISAVTHSDQVGAHVTLKIS